MLSRRERNLYERIIAILEEEVELLRHYSGIKRSSSDDPEPKQQPIPMASYPLSVPEEAEDIEYALKNGLIDTSEAEAILKAIEAENTFIEFDNS